MSKLSKEELLVWLKCRFCNEDTPCDGCIRLKQGCTEKQAYQQIRELIQKPGVTEEWIGKWTRVFAHSTPGYLGTLDEVFKEMLKEAGVHIVVDMSKG